MLYVLVVGLLSLIFTLYTMNHFIICLCYRQRIWILSGIGFFISSLILAFSTYYLAVYGIITMLNISIAGLIVGSLYCINALRYITRDSPMPTPRRIGGIMFFISSLIIASSAYYLVKNISVSYIICYIPLAISLLFLLLIIKDLYPEN